MKWQSQTSKKSIPTPYLLVFSPLPNVTTISITAASEHARVTVQPTPSGAIGSNPDSGVANQNKITTMALLTKCTNTLTTSEPPPT